ncbi:MAG: hypothetical protein WCG25_06700 [bacterium]
MDRDERVRKNLDKSVILSEAKNPGNIDENKIIYSIEPKFD